MLMSLGSHFYGFFNANVNHIGINTTLIGRIRPMWSCPRKNKNKNEMIMDFLPKYDLLARWEKKNLILLEKKKKKMKN